MGRFINCFILVILKFKMATNDHIGSNFVNISPARNDSKLFQSVCVCSVYCAILCSS